MRYHIFFLLFFLFPSCVHKKCTQETFTHACNIPLCIEMPKNKLVFENVAPLVYDALWNHFHRVGFTMVDSKKEGYTLRVVIQDVDSSYKFLSPDLLTYAVKMKIELLCQLFDYNHVVKAKKLFTFATLISKPKRYVDNSAFTDFEYRCLLERQVHKIDHFFRPFFMKDN